jgi:hypothetical protein
MKRAIEEDFPIVEINRLAIPERNSFKPIYQMHKWFARRASCVFRAILLGALKPAGTNIMEEFYKDHSKDPDTNGVVVLDPFMGGGTTVVEALRLGCKVVGIDLNPVAWFIVKNEVEPVDLDELEAAFQRLANRIVPWSGKPLRETLLELYKTTPPWTADKVCGLTDSDIIYTFWAKSALCTSLTCRKQVPLFSDYIIAAKSPSVRYYPDCKCPKCNADFDWEIEPASLIADPSLMFHGNAYSGGVGRSNARWTYTHEEGGIYVCQGKSIWKKDCKITESSPEWIHVLRQHQVKTGMLEAGHVCCPNCNQIVRPRLTTKKKRRKKVPLIVLLCPKTEDVFQWRGELAEGAMVSSPAGHTFDPHKGNVPEKGRFLCPHCGHNDAIIESIRALPENQLVPMHAYGLHAYAPGCDPANDPDKRAGGARELFGNGEESEEGEEAGEKLIDTMYSGAYIAPTHNLIWKQKGKFYARHAPIDQARYHAAVNFWQKHGDSLPYPKSEIPPGDKTSSGLLAHHYIENRSRGLTIRDFEDGLTCVLRKSAEKMRDDGLIVFTFHHAEASSWESVMNSVCNASLVIEAIYPVHSEREASLHLQDNEAIAYDLIHVCRKRRTEDTRAKRSWAGLRQLVRQRAREEITRIEAGRYGGEPLPPPDVRMVLIGKCLEVYSRHYGAVIDWNGEPFPLKAALQDIRMMVEQIVSRETPLPSELENIDALSQVWLLALCDKREVSVDSISKITRGVFEVSDLTGHKPPLLRKGRIKGGRTYEVLAPLERASALRERLRGATSTSEQLTLLDATDNTPIVIGPKLVDVIHLLAANAEQGERLDNLVERFRGQREQIRAALEYLKQRDPNRWANACDKLLPFCSDLFAQAVVANSGG